MKKLYTLLAAILLTTSVFAQAPEGFNYQALARDSAGDIIVNTTIAVQFDLRETTLAGTIIYTETHNPTTNGNGVFNLVMGQGTSIFGVFNTIDWASDSHFLEVSIDPANGTAFTSLGTTQLLSVPYALHAKTSEDTPISTSDLVNNSGFVSSGNSSNMQPFTGIYYIIATQGVFPSSFRATSNGNVNRGTTPFLGEIIMFAGNFAPTGWALCDGQLLSIQSNTSLFSLLGTTYGGDGETTFALPDLRGRTPVHPGTGPGLSTRYWGQKSGSETVD